MTTGFTAKEQALVGIGAAIAGGCQPCTAKYVEAARAAGACERSIRLAVETALAERQKATEEMAEWARVVQGTIPVVDDAFRAEKLKNAALIACVAAHTVHASAPLKANRARALDLGWSVAQIELGFGVGRSVVKTATQNADASVTGSSGAETGSCCEQTAERPTAPESSASGCGCGGNCASA